MKVLLIVFFDCNGVVHHEFLPQDRTVNKIMRRLFRGKSKQELLAIPKNAFQKCFEDWKKRWHKCIISEGGLL